MMTGKCKKTTVRVNLEAYSIARSVKSFRTILNIMTIIKVLYLFCPWRQKLSNLGSRLRVAPEKKGPTEPHVCGAGPLGGT